MQAPAATRDNAASAAAETLSRLRARAPRVHCITNSVAQAFTANVLLAAGCVPSMTLAPEEVAGFAASAQALMVNLGTFDAERSAACEIAVQTANAKALPWVLDPVFIERSAPRATFARHLVSLGPRVLRLNKAEFTTLAGGEPAPETVRQFAREHRLTVALSGATDIVTDGARRAAIANGDPLMAKVTAMGCAASALLAACLAVDDDAFEAARAALLIIGVAGEVAADRAAGPGSFAVAILDALANLDAATLTRRAKVT
jgi:hydroxyethylthiazole kinase